MSLNLRELLVKDSKSDDQYSIIKEKLLPYINAYRNADGSMPKSNDELIEILSYDTNLQKKILELSLEERVDLQNLLSDDSRAIQKLLKEMEDTPTKIHNLTLGKPEGYQKEITDLANNYDADLSAKNEMNELATKTREMMFDFYALFKLNAARVHIAQSIHNLHVAASESFLVSMHPPSPWHQRHRKALINAAVVAELSIPFIAAATLVCIYPNETVRFLNDAGNAIVDTGNDVNNAFNDSPVGASFATLGTLVAVALIAVAIRYYYQKSENNVTKPEQTLSAETIDHAEAPAASPSPSPSLSPSTNAET